MSRLERFDAGIQKVTEQRGGVYGHPSVDFDRAARLKDVVKDCPDPLVRHALEMICVKVARLIQTPDHEDSWLDIAGYARTGVMCLDATKPHPLAGDPIEALTFGPLKADGA
jgi:hypothetical protein